MLGCYPRGDFDTTHETRIYHLVLFSQFCEIVEVRKVGKSCNVKLEGEGRGGVDAATQHQSINSLALQMNKATTQSAGPPCNSPFASFIIHS